MLESFAFPQLFGRTFSDATWLGSFGVASLLFGLLLTELIRRRVALDTQRRAVRAMVALTALEALFMFGFALLTNFWLALIAMYSMNAVGSAVYPIRSAWLNREITDSSSRATVLSALELSFSFGQIVGGPPAGWVGSRFGLRVAMTTVGCLLLPIPLIYQRAMPAKSGQPVKEII